MRSYKVANICKRPMLLFIAAVFTLLQYGCFVAPKMTSHEEQVLKSGHVAYKKGDYTAAYEIYSKFLNDTGNESWVTWRGDASGRVSTAAPSDSIESSDEEAGTLNPHFLLYERIGKLNELSGKYNEAREMYIQGIGLADLITLQGAYGRLYTDSPYLDEAKYYRSEYCRSLSILSINMGEYSKAIGFVKQAIDNDSRMSKKHLLALDYNLMSTILDSVGYYSEALEYANKAIQIHQSSMDPKKMQWIGSDFQRIGQIYKNMGQYSESIDYFEKALRIHKAHLNMKGTADCFVGLGETFIKLGDYEKAVDQFNKAMKIVSKDVHPDVLVEVYNGMGIARSYLDQDELALINLNNAYDLAKALKNMGRVSKIGLTLAIVRKQSGNYEDALNIALESYEIAKKMGSMDIVNNMLILADIHTARNNVVEAQKYLKLAESILKDLNKPELKWYYHKIMGDAASQEGKSDVAISEYKKSIDTIEDIRSSLKIDSFKSGFVGNKIEIYEDIVGLFIKTGSIRQGLEYVERAKARAFVDLMGQAKLLSNKKIDSDKLLEKERELRSQIAALQKGTDQVAQLKNNQGNRNQIIAYDTQIKQLMRDHQDVSIELERKNPKLASIVTINTASVQEIQSLLGRNQTMVEYFVAKEKTFIFTVTKDRINVAEISISRKSLFSQVNQLRLSITNNDNENSQIIAEKLYEELIAPVYKYLKSSELIVVPHSVLHYLPYSALVHKGKYLIENYTLTYLPSATVMKYISLGTENSQKSILAVGNPYLGKPELDLPAAEYEVKQIKEIYPSTQIFLKKDANRTNISSGINDKRIIHFASHGEYNELFPLQSALRLSPVGADDGRLTTTDILSFNLSAEMVVMSACQTGLGKLTMGDEVIGLNRAFLFAGASSVVSSLWNVNDEITALLMSHFYRNIQTMSKSEALQKAQLAILKSRVKDNRERSIKFQNKSKNIDPSHPFFWAAFVLTGK